MDLEKSALPLVFCCLAQNDALLRKQTAIYSLQRKLKACQQDLRSKELHMSLLQKKMENLEPSLKSTGYQKKELESATSNVKLQ